MEAGGDPGKKGSRSARRRNSPRTGEHSKDKRRVLRRRGGFVGNGGIVAAVSRGGLGWDLALRPGDRVLAVNGSEPQDAIDLHYMTCAEHLELHVLKPSGEEVLFDIEKDADEALGIEFDEPLFDGVRRCCNRCLFCFVDMLPRGLRDDLYVKDDDYRLSFLHGNFISLTNMEPGDLERIARQGLSPLYVSVHSTAPEVRARMMGNPRAARIMEDLSDLVSRGIRVHAQVVLVPGVNDGAGLEKTVRDLASLHPGLASAGIVPVGLGRNLPRGLRSLTQDEAARLAAWGRGVQEEFHEVIGYPFVFLADEVYIRAGLDFPPAYTYADYPQLENGIGLASRFLKPVRRHGLVPPANARECTLLTGVGAEGILRGAVKALCGSQSGKVEIVVARNSLFGEGVTVAGLLGGGDILQALHSRKGSGRVLVPSVALRSQGDLFLDGMTPEELERRLGSPVEIVDPTGRGLINALCGGGRLGGARRHRGTAKRRQVHAVQQDMPEIQGHS
jgi:putative radical SAM enzyme (TIGR03279 family)